MKTVCETLGVAPRISLRVPQAPFPEPEDAHHSRIGNWWRISRPSSPTCPPTAIGVSMPSNGMAEAFVKTFKRDYVAVNPTPDAETVMAQLPFWFEHYNNLHPHSALGYQSPREFISSQSQT